MSETPTAQQKTDTLFGGRLVQVTRLNGTTEEVRVTQLTIGQYEKAFTLIDDEIALVAFVCGKDKAWIMGNPQDSSDGVAPESYEALHQAMQEVNARGFFFFAERQRDRRARTDRELLAVVGALPTETVRMAVEMGSTSPTSSPRPRPVRG